MCFARRRALASTVRYAQRTTGVEADKRDNEESGKPYFEGVCIHQENYDAGSNPKK